MTPPRPLTLILLCPSYADDIIHLLVSAVSKAAGRHRQETGQLVLVHLYDGEALGPASGKPRPDNQLYDLIEPSRYDGVIGFGGVLATGSGTEALAEFYRRFGDLPVVDITSEIPGVSSVVCDNEGGSHALTRHLIEVHGHRDLGYLSGPHNHREAQARRQGFLRALGESGLAFNQDFLWEGNFGHPSAKPCADDIIRWFQSGERHPRAVVCGNDDMAGGLVARLTEAGLRIPADVAVCGFDNHRFTATTTPALTTVDPSFGAMATQAFACLMELIRTPAPSRGPARRIFSPTSLVLRESCGCSMAAAERVAPEISMSQDYIELRDSRYNISLLNQELNQNLSRRQFQNLVEDRYRHFGVSNWAIFLAQDPPRGPLTIDYAAQGARRLRGLWDCRGQVRPGMEEQPIRLIRPLVWDSVTQGAILLDGLPRTIYACRDLSLAFNQYMTAQASKRKLREQNRRLEASIRLQRETQNQLVETQKVAALGHLLAGFSHEINTPLGNAITVISFLEEQVATLASLNRVSDLGPEGLTRHLGSMVENSALLHSSLDRVRDLIKQFQFLTSASEEDVVTSVDLDEAIDYALVLRKPLLDQARVVVQPVGRSGISLPTLGNRLRVVLDQLIDNALSHAWPGGGGGSLSFELEQSAHAVRVHYRDDGVGIAPDILDRLFEPFCTTARHDHHIGLGLHLVHLTVTQNLGGTIVHDRHDRRGLHFIITLPRGRGDGQGRSARGGSSSRVIT